MDIVEHNKKKISEYLKHQLGEDQIANQISLKEFMNPLSGSKNPKA